MTQPSLRTLTTWWDSLPRVWQYVLAHQSFHNWSQCGECGNTFDRTCPIPVTATQLRAIYQLSNIRVQFHADTIGYDFTLDLMPLTFLPRLRRLSLNYVSLATLEPLSRIKGLQELILTGAWFYDSFNEHATLEPLQHLKQLVTLVMTPRLGRLEINLEIIASLHRLHYLRLCDTTVSHIYSLAPLNRLQHLVELDVSGCSITTIADVWQLPLKVLYLPTHIPESHIDEYRRHHPECRVVVHPS